MLLKKTNGKQSHSLTMAWIAFGVVTLWLLLSTFEKIAGLQTRAFDPASSMAYLTPILLNYFGGKWVDALNTSRKTEESK